MSKWLCSAPIALVLPLLVGCAVDQAKEVAKYRSIIDLRQQEIGFASDQPLSLRQAMLLANAHNERLAIEGESFVQALIAKRRATAGFLPTVDLTGQYTHLEPSANKDLSRLGVDGNINLFNGFRDVESLRRATATIEQRRNLLLDAQQTLMLDVAQVYYQVLRSQRSVSVLENSLKVQEERLRDVQARQAVGNARPLDVSQTKAQASATRVQWIGAQNDVRNGRALLAFLTSAAVQDSPLTDEFPLPETFQELSVYQASAERQRPDLLAAAKAVEAAQHDVRYAFGRYYPSLSLNLSAVLASNPSSVPDWTSIVQANLPIFSAGVIEADVRDAWSRFRQAVASAGLKRRQAQQEVQTAYQDLSANRQRLGELRTQLTAAEEAFRQADQSYNVGLATNLERMTAQDQLLSAQLQLASAEYNHKVFYLNLLRSVGEMRREDQVLPG